MKYQQLTKGLRYQIALLCEDKVSQAESGRRLGVCKSTVSRELRRNRSVDGYQPAVAQKLSTSRRKAAGKRRGRVRQGGVNSDPAFRSGNMSVKR
ncbi:hypothetical protein EWM60_20680 [Candidatus Erwinia dacicola]|nr:hypothetical protein [Candidatus Erwinia dacicola]